MKAEPGSGAMRTQATEYLQKLGPGQQRVFHRLESRDPPRTLVSGFWPPDLRGQLCAVLWHFISGPQVPQQGEPGLEAQQSVPRQHWYLEINLQGTQAD